jgi:hypothetical protein
MKDGPADHHQDRLSLIRMVLCITRWLKNVLCRTRTVVTEPSDKFMTSSEAMVLFRRVLRVRFPENLVSQSLLLNAYVESKREPTTYLKFPPGYAVNN